VLPVENEVKLLVLVVAFAVSATLACLASAQAPQQGETETTESELTLGSRRLAVASLLGPSKVRTCIAFRFAQITRFMVALVLNCHKFRPVWMAMWYAMLYIPFGLWTQSSAHLMLTEPLSVLFPMRGLFLAMRPTDKIHFALNLIDIAPFLVLELGHHDLLEPHVLPAFYRFCDFVEGHTGLVLHNNLAQIALAEQAFGGRFYYVLKIALYVATSIYFSLALAIMSLPHDIGKIMRELPKLAEEIEAVAKKRLEEAKQHAQPSSQFPPKVTPVKAWKECWKDGPKLMPGVLIKNAMQFMLDIITDTYAWVLFLHHHDYFFSGLLATVSWLSTLLQIRQGLWGRMLDEFRTSNICGVMTSGWIQHLDIEKGLEALFSSLVQMYAFLFAGFQNLPTTLFTTFSIGLSLKGLTDFMVDKVDLDAFTKEDKDDDGTAADDDQITEGQK